MRTHKMDSGGLATALLVAALGIGAGAALAGDRPGEERSVPRGSTVARATGEVWFWNGEHDARAMFGVRAARPEGQANGIFRYEDDLNGLRRSYSVKISCVDLGSTEGTFSGRISETDTPEWTDRWVQIWVIDLGTPGKDGDFIQVQFYDSDPMCGGETESEHHPIVGGNLIVHR